MYNRYTPQSDGSYRRSTMHNASGKPCPPPRQECAPAQTAPPVQPPQQTRHKPNRGTAPSPVRGQESGFLRQLLPQNLDTGDLLVMALLLLMAGDCQEDKNTALLTLALYLFL